MPLSSLRFMKIDAVKSMHKDLHAISKFFIRCGKIRCCRYEQNLLGDYVFCENRRIKAMF